ncbi:hypothetical protein [Gluconobacter frateurii]|uniref:Phage protein n=1 Tax=Gluconobacter frateurii NRIC 0228 TaxID=1307946 RepID=A0ABQ0Q8R6_9PROT|nr:hypothetical protein [Gluconobacter frateurii]GBR09234.1 hypothetical protein AA0228_0611 [Gluconobacter frateurii NRIC 0228]GLP90817.1 hypothetical protein GCM10007868_18920 [Gluconobacter frateurii]
MGLTLSALENAIGSVGRLGATAPVMLGDLVLTGIEVPDRLQVGGRQMMVVHRLPGGGRVVDTLGNDPGRLELTGKFLGPNAQARAQAIEKMRVRGAPVVFSAAGIALQVWIVRFVYSYEAKGALCSYELTLERPAESVGSATVGNTLSDVLGNDVDSGLTQLTDVISAVSDGLFVESGQVGSIVGQLMPLGTLVGAGGSLAKVSDALATTSALSQGATNLAGASTVLDSLSQQLSVSGQGLMSALEISGQNIENIQIENASSLSAVMGNAAVQSVGADVGGLVNRSNAYVGQAQGLTAQMPAVHS